ncbi:restriction endonuclease subunit S [Vibrio splendidus]
MSVEQTSMNQLITDNIDIWTSTVKTKSASGRGSSKKRELYGVKKLRELILELAVRGKLVPQDLTDEPASILLERIAAEKAQLVKEKKIKKPKILPPIAEVEKPFELPNGWAWARFDDLINQQYPISYGVLVPGVEVDGGVPFVRIGDISINLAPTLPEKTISKDIDAKYERTRLQGGEILMAVVGSIGKLGVAPYTWKGANIARALCRIVPAAEISKEFVLILLRSEFMQSNFQGDTRTLAQPTLNVGLIKSSRTPVPPLAEQHRIVTKVDELMTLCDQLEQQTEASIEAHQLLVTTLLDTLTNSADAEELMQNWARISEHFDTLFTTEASIDQLKQTILQLAVMGKLVPQDPNDEPAAKLLERIAEEKAQLIKDKKAKDSGKMHPKAPHGFQVVIPSSWEWCRFRDVAWCFRGHNPPKAKFIETPKEGYVRFVQITDFKTELSAVYVPESSKNKMVYKGEIIMAAYRHIGKLSRTMEGAFNVALCKVNDYPSMSRDYLELLIGTGFVKGELLNASERGHIPSMHSDHLLSLLIPLPPLAEQERILVKYNQLIDLCNMLRKGLTQNQSVQIDLTNTIIEQVV